jgi:predicted nicotinamide N-methyase
MLDDLVERHVDTPSGPLRLLQPREVAEVPDDGEVQWAPIAPYWAVLWRSGVALTRELAATDLRGKRVLELGCGLGLPSLAAARAGAEVLATDIDAQALELVAVNADVNGLTVETAAVDWAAPQLLVERAPFDLVVAADVLYEETGVSQLTALLPLLATNVWLADPGRPTADTFLGHLEGTTESEARGVVTIHKLAFP